MFLLHGQGGQAAAKGETVFLSFLFFFSFFLFFLFPFFLFPLFLFSFFPSILSFLAHPQECLLLRVPGLAV